MRLLTNWLKDRVGDDNMAWLLCGTIKQRCIVIFKAVGFHYAHLGPVSEEQVVFEGSDSKRVRSLGSTIDDNFPKEKQKPQNGYHRDDCIHV